VISTSWSREKKPTKNSLTRLRLLSLQIVSGTAPEVYALA